MCRQNVCSAVWDGALLPALFLLHHLTSTGTLPGDKSHSIPVAITKYNQNEWLINKNEFIPHSRGGWQSEIRLPAGLGPNTRAPFRVTDPLVSSVWGKGVVWDLFCKGTNPNQEGSTLMALCSLQRPPPPNTNTFGG